MPMALPPADPPVGRTVGGGGETRRTRRRADRQGPSQGVVEATQSLSHHCWRISLGPPRSCDTLSFLPEESIKKGADPVNCSLNHCTS